MAFCISLPTTRRLPADGDVQILPATEARCGAARGSIVATVGDPRVAGHWNDDAAGVAVFLSGRLTQVPARFAASTGGQAARVLGELYLQRGSSAFADVDGGYAAAIIDRRRNAVLFVRDKLGVARTYLTRDSRHVAFSDSLADLLDMEGGRFAIDRDSVRGFLSFGWIPTPNSMFEGVEKLAPGTFLEVGGASITAKVYFELPHSPDFARARPAAALRNEVAAHLDQSVDRGVGLGGRWGSFLSGGVDSSSVVSSLTRSGAKGIPTYFGGFSAQLNRYLPNPEEPAISKLVADRFATDHHSLWLGEEIVETAPEVVAALEEPVSDGGCLVLAAVMREAVGSVDGLMTGIGGDFLFTGERRHMVLNLLKLMRMAPDPVWRALRWASGAWPLARSARVSQAHFDLTRLLAIRGLSPEAMYIGFFLQAEPDDFRLLLGDASPPRRDPQREIGGFFREAAKLDPLDQFLYLDLKSNIPDDLVREAETLGKHFGVATHHPFLDAEFVTFAMSIPSSAKASGLKLKLPLKAAMRGRVPDAVLDRKKGGLGSPIRWWVTQTRGFVADVLSPSSVRRRGMFDPDAVQRFRDATANGTRDYSKLLWSLFTLELWFRRFVDGRSRA